MLSDEGSIEDLTIRHADYNQLTHIRRTSVQAIMTLMVEGEKEQKQGNRTVRKKLERNR